MNHHLKLALGLLASVVALAGCASAPLSFIEGAPQTRADPTLYPVRVVSVDGSIKFVAPDTPVQLAPGPRWLVLEAAPARGAGASVQKSFVFKVDACSHYYFAARRSSPMAADWALVVDRKESVPACNVDEELKKAQSEDASQREAAAASAPR